jgi:membrane associated rhomboid family serine protease
MKRSSGWLLVCALHGVASMLLWWAGESLVETMIWRADTWYSQPWTLLTSAWVHLNTPQLIVNQIALGLLAAFAWVVRPSWPCTLAWLLAWPLTQVSLLWWPHIGYAVGLSGPLHAGAMILAVQLMLQRIAVPKAGRWGALLALGLLAKLALEQGWWYPVVWDSANAISVVRAAHLSGAVWGAALALLLGWIATRQRARHPAALKPAGHTPFRESSPL